MHLFPATDISKIQITTLHKRDLSGTFVNSCMQNIGQSRSHVHGVQQFSISRRLTATKSAAPLPYGVHNAVQSGDKGKTKAKGKGRKRKAPEEEQEAESTPEPMQAQAADDAGQSNFQANAVWKVAHQSEALKAAS